MHKTNNQDGARFDPVEHRYYLNDRRVVGITEALKSVGISPSFEGIPSGVLANAGNRGSRVHLLTQLDDENDLGEYAPEDGGYLAAWRKFKKEHDFRPEIIERFFVHPVFYFGGTPDRGGYLGSKKATLEIKTTASGVEDWVEVQTALQSLLLADCAGFKSDVRVAVALYDDGGYDVRYFKDHKAQALGLAAVAIANYKLGRK